MIAGGALSTLICSPIIPRRRASPKAGERRRAHANATTVRGYRGTGGDEVTYTNVQLVVTRKNPTSWATKFTTSLPPHKRLVAVDANQVETTLVHAADERVDLVFAVTSHTPFDEVLLLLGHTTVRGGELERPQKVGALLEVRTASVNFVNQIFDANDPLVAKHLLDHGVVRERDSLLVHLTVTTLVDQFSNGLQVRVTEHDVRLNLAELVERRLVGADEDAVVDLTQAEKLKNLLRLRVDVVQTTQAHDEDELVLGFDVETTLRARLALEADEVGFLCLVKTDVVVSRSFERAVHRA